MHYLPLKETLTLLNISDRVSSFIIAATNLSMKYEMLVEIAKKHDSVPMVAEKIMPTLVWLQRLRDAGFKFTGVLSLMEYSKS